MYTDSPQILGAIIQNSDAQTAGALDLCIFNLNNVKFRKFMLPFSSESLSPHLFPTSVTTEINKSIILPVLFQLGFTY